MKKVILILVCMVCMAEIWADHLVETAECGCPKYIKTSGTDAGSYYVVHGDNCKLKPTPQEDPTPTITLSPDTFSGWYNQDQTITVKVYNISSSSSPTVSDTENSKATLEYEYSPFGPSTYTYTVNTTGEHVITFTARNGTKSATKQITILFDNIQPKVSLKATPQGWFSGSYTLQYTIEEVNSGISSLYINGKSTGSSKEKQSYTVSGEGSHSIRVYATDKAGNTSKTCTTTVNIDNTAPVITPTAVYFNKNDDGKLISLSIDMNITDNLSGLATANIKLNQLGKQNISLTTGTKSVKQTINYAISNLNRGTDNTFEITATDQAGNEKKETISVYIPEEMSLTVDSQNKKLKLWNINAEKESVSLTRTIWINETQIDNTDTLSSFFNVDCPYTWSNQNLPLEAMGDLWNRIYKVEGITTSTLNNDLGPFGHKDVTYTVKRLIANPIPKNGEPFCVEEFSLTDSNPVNHKANLTLRLQGIDSYVELNPSQPITAETISDLHLDSDGAVRLLFKMEDEDAEPYHVKLRTIPYAEKDGFSIGIPVEGFEADFISEKCKSTINRKTYIHPDEDGWYAFDNRLFLPFNHSQVYLLEWDEGFEQKNYVSCETEMIPLKAEPTNLGGFTLGVDESALYNANGITATVHHEFELSINEQDQSDITDISWDFGADSTSVRTEKLASTNGYSVVYGQNEDRSGNTSEYILTLTVMHKNGLEKTVPLTVFIEDTRCGKLLGNETWRGQHLLLGEVIVPGGYEITFEENKINPDNKTEILCYGSSRQNEKGKLTIENGASVIISTDLSFQEAKNTQSQGFIAVEDSDNKLMWAGIEVSGSLTSEGSSLVSIIGAQRGLILRGGGIINLAKITIKDCLCGLHIIGGNTGAKLTLTEGTITQNSEYGVKIETDSSGSNNNDLTFNKVVITNNGRDSYMNGKFNVINGGE